MNIPFSKAPHIEGASAVAQSGGSPNAALLIDFDNVTMGIRSDLSKELKTLLGSDVIRGKVTVQRAYADWRRYPQYIVPLSEASIDLIFAPAYGSNKKNATDIRMAIDGMELVFTRPEIGTFILLTGDSDFSSLVLKLKEYGKYVIGVGMQESSSDILVQNCDEYYSYTSLSGLTKADEGGSVRTDPWKLIEEAVEQMGRRGDVMRSDRLKQVMLEIDPGFDEKGLGFGKFSRFMAEASRRGIVEIRRMENGQHEILTSKKAGPSTSPRRGRPSRHEKRPAEKTRDARPPSQPAAGAASRDSAATAAGSRPSRPPETLDAAYGLLREAVSELLRDTESGSVRDSDVKRRMLVLQDGFSEGELGFSKFSKFLQRAEENGVVELHRSEAGNLHVSLGSGSTVIGLELLGLPSGDERIMKYLSNSYGGVGKRTAETLVDALGDQLFHVLENDPSRVQAILPRARAERVLAGWRADIQRRTERYLEAEGSGQSGAATPPPESPPDAPAQTGPRARRGRRTRVASDPGD